MDATWRMTQTVPAAQDAKLREAIDRAGQIWQAANKPAPGIKIELWALINWLCDERKLWRERHRDVERSIQAEGQDPAGTIWEHAEKLQQQVALLTSKLQEQAGIPFPVVH